MTRITKEQLAAMRPCSLKERLALFEGHKTLGVREAFDLGASISDILWVAGRLGLGAECAQFAKKCAERVAHLKGANTANAAYYAASAANAAAYAAYAAAYAANAARYTAYAASAANAAHYAAEVEAQKQIAVKIFGGKP